MGGRGYGVSPTLSSRRVRSCPGSARSHLGRGYDNDRPIGPPRVEEVARQHRLLGSHFWDGTQVELNGMGRIRRAEGKAVEVVRLRVVRRRQVITSAR